MQGIMSFQIIRRNNKACIILEYVIHQIEVQFAGDYLPARSTTPIKALPIISMTASSYSLQFFQVQPGKVHDAVIVPD